MGKLIHSPGSESVRSQSVGEAVVEAVAEVEGVAPSEVRPPLYEVVDPDALEALFAPTTVMSDRTGGRIVFAYGDHEVTVRADGEVSVDAAETSD